jgi:hypothetical protein
MLGRHLIKLAVAGGCTLAALFASSASAGAAVVYDNIPSPQPGNVSSYGFEADSASEFGGQLGLAGTDRYSPTVTVLMSSWGCGQSGTWFAGNCVTNPGDKFSEPVTLNLYNVDPGNAPGSLIATKTQSFQIPYRPSADNTNCTGANAGKWFDGTKCNNGLATPITFDMHGLGVKLPDQVIASVAYNTTHYGYSPIGASACSATAKGCGYDSLNVGAQDSGSPSTGTFPLPNDAYQNASTGPGIYCDNGAGGTGSFRLDAGCWTGFQPTFRVSATSGFVVNDDTTGPGPAGADCAHPDYSTIHDAISAAPAGSTILVCAGTYNETDTVNKQLTIEGAQAGVDARTRAVPSSSESILTGGGIDFTASGSTFDGFTVQNVAASPLGVGITTSGSASGQRIVNNIVQNNIFGMYLNNAPDHQTTVRHNKFDNNNNSGPASGNGIYGDAGIQNVVIDQNLITNQPNAAILLTNVPSTSVKDIQITGNQLGDRIRITEGQNMTISGNSISGSPNNGVQLDSDNRNVTISGNTITGSGLGGVRFSNFDYPADGPSENVTVNGNTLTANVNGVLVNDSGGAPAYNGVLEMHFNRIAGNTTGVALNDNADVNAQNNWWGCNAGPGTSGCDPIGGDFHGQVNASPRLVLGLSASPSIIYAGTGQSQLAADLTHNSANQAVGAGFPDGTQVAFGAAPLGTVSPAGAGTDSGVARSTLGAGTTVGFTNASATLDGQSVTSPVAIVVPPAGQTGPQGAAGPQGASGGVAGAVGSSKKCKKHRHGRKCKKK